MINIKHKKQTPSPKWRSFLYKLLLNWATFFLYINSCFFLPFTVSCKDTIIHSQIHNTFLLFSLLSVLFSRCFLCFLFYAGRNIKVKILRVNIQTLICVNYSLLLLLFIFIIFIIINFRSLSHSLPLSHSLSLYLFSMFYSSLSHFLYCVLCVCISDVVIIVVGGR